MFIIHIVLDDHCTYSRTEIIPTKPILLFSTFLTLYFGIYHHHTAYCRCGYVEVEIKHIPQILFMKFSSTNIIWVKTFYICTKVNTT